MAESSVIRSKYVPSLLEDGTRRGQFSNARDLSPAERERNGRLGTLFEDIVGSETGVINVPDGHRFGHAEQLERGSALGLLKVLGKIRGFIDLRQIEPAVQEYYKQERTHNKPDFWVLLVNGSEVEIEAKNFAKKQKDYPRPGYPPWFTRTLWMAKDDADKDWQPTARRVFAVSHLDIYTPAAIDWFRSEKVSLVEAGAQATENSDFRAIRNEVALGLYELFLGWVRL